MPLTSSPQPTDILGVFVINSRPDTTFPRMVLPKAGVVASSCSVAFLPQDGICCRLLRGHHHGRGLEGLLAAPLGPCSRSCAPLWATPPHPCTSGGVLCAAQACFNGNLGERTEVRTPVNSCCLFVEEAGKAPGVLPLLLATSGGIQPIPIAPSNSRSACWNYPQWRSTCVLGYLENGLRVPIPTTRRWTATASYLHCHKSFSLPENKIWLQSGGTELQMTWHFSFLGDYFALGDAFTLKESHHNSNLWEIGSVLFTSKQEELSPNYYWWALKDCSTVAQHKPGLHFIPQPALVCTWSSAASPVHAGHGRWSLKLQQVADAPHQTFSSEERLTGCGWRTSLLFAIWMLKGSSGWREACEMSKKALSVQQVMEGSQLSACFLLSVEGRWGAQVTPPSRTHSFPLLKDCRK